MMRTVLHAAIGIAMVGTAAIAPAQLLGGRAGVGVGVGAGVNTPAIGSTVRGTTDAVRSTSDSVRDTARSSATVKVEAGASTRVDRGTRCYYQPDDYYYDPVYRDGYYYCEQRTSGAGVAAGASVKTTPR